MTLSISTAFAGAARVGEGPVWDARDGVLRWVDIPAGAVFAAPPDGPVSTRILPTMVGAALPAAGGDLLVASGEGFGLLDRDDYDARLDVLAPDERMNDAKVDAQGRAWAGSTPREFRTGAGRLHRLDPDWTHRVVLDGLTLPNGLDWSPDGRTFYLADSLQHVLRAYAFDARSGELSQARDLVRFTASDGLPDGLCVAAGGTIWLAMWGAGELRHLAPDGRLLATVPVPVRQPSSCCFGGADLATLFVTSARDGLDPAARDSDPDGSVLAITGTGCVGRPPTLFAAAPGNGT